MNTISKSKPSYRVVMTPSKFVVDKKEKLEIVIYFTGDGAVEDAKIGIYTDENSKLAKEGEDAGPNKNTIFSNPDKYFKPLATAKGLESEANFLVSEAGEITGSHEDGTYEKRPPVQYCFESEYSGDHYITTVLSYHTTRDGWQTAEKTIKIHVNSHFEQYQTFYVVMGLIIALIAIFISGIINDKVRALFGKIIYKS